MHKENIFDLFNSQNPNPVIEPTAHDVVTPTDVKTEVVTPTDVNADVVDTTPTPEPDNAATPDETSLENERKEVNENGI